MSYGARLAGEKGCPKLGGFEQKKSEIMQIDNLIIAACGTSKHAGFFVSRLFKMLHCFNTIQVCEASEFTEKDLPFNKSGVLMVT